MKKITKFLSLLLVLLTVFSVFALNASAASKLSQVKNLTAYGIDDDDINLKWSAVKGAKGYQVYRYSPAAGKYIKIGTTSRTYIEADDLHSAKAYKFKVRAYAKSGSKTIYSPYSAVLVTATKPDEVDGLRVSSKGKTTLTVKWDKVSRATKYQVYVYNSAKEKYERKATVSTNSAKLTGLKSGATYKIKVRAYFKSNEKYYYGDYSDVLHAKTSGKATASSDSGKNIGTSKAINIALEHAGLSKSKVRELECHLDRENGIYIYEVEFEYGRYDYEYEINAKTGKILTVEKDS